MIEFANAKYLKHAGAELDVKVSIRQIDGKNFIYIRDQEFTTFDAALKCLQRIAADEIPSGKCPHGKYSVITCGICSQGVQS